MAPTIRSIFIPISSSRSPDRDPAFGAGLATSSFQFLLKLPGLYFGASPGRGLRAGRGPVYTGQVTDVGAFDSLLELCHLLGDPSLDLTIFAEGNASTRADEDSFWVKASGFCMRTLPREGLTRVWSAPILEAIDRQMSDAEVAELLRSARAEDGQKPSTETFMHAWLLTLPNVNFVGHAHPTAWLSLACLEFEKERCKIRLCPDEIVCCGPETVYVPYCDPGLELARTVREKVQEFIRRRGETPKMISMQNHGVIALGRTAKEVETAMSMGVKLARVWLGILASNQRPTFLSSEQILRIHGRPDEHERQKLLFFGENAPH